MLDLLETIPGRFGFQDYEVMLSTRPDKSVGTGEGWRDATASLEAALRDKGWEYSVDECGGAFYGPKSTRKSATLSNVCGDVPQCRLISICRTI